MEIELAVYSLSTLASTLSIASSIKAMALNSKITFADAFRTYVPKSEEEKELLERDDIVETVSYLGNTQRISIELLTQFTNDALECKKTHIANLQQFKPDTLERIQANEGASRCVCSVLKDIKLHNANNLPTELLENMWEEYRCSN